MRPSKIVCVGRNYADHAAELGNAIPDTPILFIKPPSSIVSMQHGIYLPQHVGECHYECELTVRVGSTLKQADAHTAFAAINGVTLGLDLTLRDVQNALKQKGHPWERAKAFDGACVLGEFLAKEMIEDYKNAHYRLLINEQVRQTGNTALMLFGVAALVAHISHVFTLEAGDVVMTGTPAGVGALHPGDQLQLCLDTLLGEHIFHTTVHA